ncbi:hypothetical protein BN14_07249 [Rhizoctonia solani AG-1 IB]|uniref:Uncharacterized protein n=2 Tax=Rhizoctonia solani TaxID=456999 RepID=A0A8H2WFN5_9AGAM|nr:unnamed protein product [Rhizoctonia solani]CCO33177.1 hypothetical protein BN14_07249 [Rhizoctonia solani AG-1 IB]
MLSAFALGIIGILTYSGWIRSIPVDKWGIPMIVCLITILSLDAVVIVTTVKFLKGNREGMSRHKGVLHRIWQIMWASTAPPTALLVVAAINEVIPGKRSGLTAIFTTMSAKTYEISLMTSIVGQGYIRRQIERYHLHGTPRHGDETEVYAHDWT